MATIVVPNLQGTEHFTCALPAVEESTEIRAYVVLRSDQTGPQFRGAKITVWVEPGYGPRVGHVVLSSPEPSPWDGREQLVVEQLLRENP